MSVKIKVVATHTDHDELHLFSLDEVEGTQYFRTKDHMKFDLKVGGWYQMDVLIEPTQEFDAKQLAKKNITVLKSDRISDVLPTKKSNNRMVDEALIKTHVVWNQFFEKDGRKHLIAWSNEIKNALIYMVDPNDRREYKIGYDGEVWCQCFQNESRRAKYSGCNWLITALVDTSSKKEGLEVVVAKKVGDRFFSVTINFILENFKET